MKDQDKIKVGDLIYRIFPSGHKVVGVAAHINKNADFPRSIKEIYDCTSRRKSWTGFFSLENYPYEGGVHKMDGYGKGNYEYEKVFR